MDKDIKVTQLLNEVEAKENCKTFKVPTEPKSTKNFMQKFAKKREELSIKGEINTQTIQRINGTLCLAPQELKNEVAKGTRRQSVRFKYTHGFKLVP